MIYKKLEEIWSIKILRKSFMNIIDREDREYIDREDI